MPKLKPVLGERLGDCLVARDHAATDSKFGNDGASRDWPAAAVSFGKGNKPAGQHAVSRTHRQRIVADKADEFLDCFATSVVVHEHHHEFSRPSPDVGGGAVRDGPRGFLEGAVRELQASGSARRDRRKLEPAGLWVKRDQLLDNLRCGIEDAITRTAALQGLDRFLEEALLSKPDCCLDCRELCWSEEVCLFFLLFPPVGVAASRWGRFWQCPFDDLEEVALDAFVVRRS